MHEARPPTRSVNNIELCVRYGVWVLLVRAVLLFFLCVVLRLYFVADRSGVVISAHNPETRDKGVSDEHEVQQVVDDVLPERHLLQDIGRVNVVHSTLEYAALTVENLAFSHELFEIVSPLLARFVVQRLYRGDLSPRYGTPVFV